MPTTMTENKDLIVREWYESLWNKWNLDTVDRLFSQDYRLHVSGAQGPADRATAKEIVRMFSKAFPDLHHDVDEIIADGDTVAARWSVTGTHQGDFQGLAPTNKPIKLSGTTFHRVNDGRIVESWLTLDNLDLMKQLGVA